MQKLTINPQILILALTDFLIHYSRLCVGPDAKLLRKHQVTKHNDLFFRHLFSVINEHVVIAGPDAPFNVMLYWYDMKKKLT